MAVLIQNIDVADCAPLWGPHFAFRKAGLNCETEVGLMSARVLQGHVEFVSWPPGGAFDLDQIELFKKCRVPLM